MAGAVGGAAASLPGAALAAADNALLPRNLSPWGMFMGADIVVKAVMIGLAFASLVTWTVWLAKSIELRRKASQARRRLGRLECDNTLAEVEHESRGASDAVAQLIQSAARELAGQLGAGELPADAALSVEMREEVELVTEPERLVPHFVRVRRERRIEAEHAGERRSALRIDETVGTLQ